MELPNKQLDPLVQQNFDYLAGWIFLSKGDPNGQIRGPVGALCLNILGGAGTTLWTKESGMGTATGWVAK